jgi:GDP-mannose transporter
VRYSTHFAFPPLELDETAATMSDKKNEDFVVRMPESSAFETEKDPFMGRHSPSGGLSHRRSPSASAIAAPLSKIDNSPGASIMAYCVSSISMTVVNKYVVSGRDWNLNFFYLAVQVSAAPLEQAHGPAAVLMVSQ